MPSTKTWAALSLRLSLRRANMSIVDLVHRCQQHIMWKRGGGMHLRRKFQAGQRLTQMVLQRTDHDKHERF